MSASNGHLSGGGEAVGRGRDSFAEGLEPLGAQAFALSDQMKLFERKRVLHLGRRF